jgi:hypothetical protein
VEELDHKASEALEGTWYADCRADFYEDSFGGVNVDLKLSSFVYWRVEKSKLALVQRMSQSQLNKDRDFSSACGL